MGRSSFCLGLFTTASALRIADIDRVPSTTSASIRAYTYYSDSVVKCVAGETLHIRSPDGSRRQVPKGEPLFSGPVPVRVDNEGRFVPWLWTRWVVRHTATIQIQIEDVVLGHAPAFTCEVHNSASNGVECEKTSTAVTDEGAPRFCAVEIEIKKQNIDVEIAPPEKSTVAPEQEIETFYVKGWTTIGPSTLVCCTAEKKYCPGLGRNLFQGGLSLQEREANDTEANPKIWEGSQEMMMTADKKNGFVCAVVMNDKTLCEANSWEVTPRMVATQPNGCLIKITRESEQMVVHYPSDFFRGWRRFVVLATALVSTGHKQFELSCRALTELTLDHGRHLPGYFVSVGGSLMVEKKVKDWRPTKMELQFRDYNQRTDRFACIVSEGYRTLCEANSWEMNNPVSSEPKQCKVEIKEIPFPW